MGGRRRRRVAERRAAAAELHRGRRGGRDGNGDRAQTGFAGKTVILRRRTLGVTAAFEAPKVKLSGPEYPAAGVYVTVPAVASSAETVPWAGAEGCGS